MRNNRANFQIRTHPVAVVGTSACQLRASLEGWTAYFDLGPSLPTQLQLMKRRTKTAYLQTGLWPGFDWQSKTRGCQRLTRGDGNRCSDAHKKLSINAGEYGACRVCAGVRAA